MSDEKRDQADLLGHDLRLDSGRCLPWCCVSMRRPG